MKKKNIIWISLLVILSITVVIILSPLIKDAINKPNTPSVHPITYEYASFEELAQDIKDGSFLEKTDTLSDHIKDTMINTNLIKPLINGVELEYYNEIYGGPNITVYYPMNTTGQQGYYVLYRYPNYEDHVLFSVEYLLDNNANDNKANYDAVINGENVRIHYFTLSGNRHFGLFRYKDMYEVEMMAYDKELFDIVFSNLTIEEISVK